MMLNPLERWPPLSTKTPAKPSERMVVEGVRLESIDINELGRKKQWQCGFGCHGAQPKGPVASIQTFIRESQ